MAEKRIAIERGGEGVLKVEKDKVTIELPNPDALTLEDIEGGKELLKLCSGCSGLISGVARVVG